MPRRWSVLAWRSCDTLHRSEDESSVIELRQLLDAAAQHLDGSGDAPGVAAGIVPDVLQQGESDPAQLGEPIADEGLRLAQLLRLHRRGGPLRYGGETGPALLVATPYGLEAGGARLGFRRLVAMMVGAAV